LHCMKYTYISPILALTTAQNIFMGINKQFAVLTLTDENIQSFIMCSSNLHLAPMDHIIATMW